MSCSIKPKFMRRIAVLATALPLGLGQGARSEAPQSQPSIIVKPAVVEEQRARWFDARARYMPKGLGELEVQLRLEGEVLRSATTYANVRVDDALDDLNHSIIPPVPKIRAAARATKVMSVLNEEGHAPAILVRVPLGHASRDALKIARLKGQLQIHVGGQPTVIAVRKLKSALGTRVLDPTLGKIGAKLRILGGPNASSVYVAGDPSLVSEVQVVDADGTMLAKSPPPTAASPNILFSLPRAIDNDMSLQFIVSINPTIVTVPFDLKDIALP